MPQNSDAYLPQLEAVDIFFSVAPQDKNLFSQLHRHLSPLWRKGIINIVDERAELAGESTSASMSGAHIFVLLISASFFASDRCFVIEMPYALAKHDTGDADIIPVLLRPTEWHGFSLEELSLLPSNGKAVSNWRNRDNAFTEVVQGIRKVVDKIAAHLRPVVQAAPPPQFPLWVIRHQQNPYFTNRAETLKVLHDYFTTGETTQTRTQALQGLGGIGKTLLAVEYAYRHRNEYQAVLWLRAASQNLLSADLLTIARELGLSAQDELEEQERIDAIRRWLANSDRWLLVLDDLQDFSVLDQLVPSRSSGHVLLTTPIATTGLFVHTISLDQLDLTLVSWSGETFEVYYS